MAGHLKYCYGACVKCNRHLPKEELSLKVYNVLEHICKNHDNCDSAWCNDLKAKEKLKFTMHHQNIESKQRIKTLTYN